MSGRIEGKIAIVVGAAQGIGEVIATRFVEEGAKVVIADVLDEAGQATAERLGETYVRTDISDFEAAKEANYSCCPKLWDSRYYCTERGNLSLDFDRKHSTRRVGPSLCS